MIPNSGAMAFKYLSTGPRGPTHAKTPLRHSKSILGKVFGWLRSGLRKHGRTLVTINKKVVASLSKMCRTLFRRAYKKKHKLKHLLKSLSKILKKVHVLRWYKYVRCLGIKIVKTKDQVPAFSVILHLPILGYLVPKGEHVQGFAITTPMRSSWISDNRQTLPNTKGLSGWFLTKFLQIFKRGFRLLFKIFSVFVKSGAAEEGKVFEQFSTLANVRCLQCPVNTCCDNVESIGIFYHGHEVETAEIADIGEDKMVTWDGKETTYKLVLNDECNKWKEMETNAESPILQDLQLLKINSSHTTHPYPFLSGSAWEKVADLQLMNASSSSP